MTTNNKPVRCKQQRIQTRAKNSDSYSFFNVLTGPEMLSTVEDLLPEDYRERLFPPTETLSMFLAQAMNEDRSCQKAVDDAAIKRAIGGLSPCSTGTSGFCQAPCVRIDVTLYKTHINRDQGAVLSKKWRVIRASVKSQY